MDQQLIHVRGCKRDSLKNFFPSHTDLIELGRPFRCGVRKKIHFSMVKISFFAQLLNRI
jgi:hypothetical protein